MIVLSLLKFLIIIVLWIYKRMPLSLVFKGKGDFYGFKSFRKKSTHVHIEIWQKLTVGKSVGGVQKFIILFL